MNTHQIELTFEEPQLLHGTHPLRYHLLRVGAGDLAGCFWHVNSVWEGYNSSGYPEGETESRLSKYTFANSKQEIKQIIEGAAKDNKTHYIMAKMSSEIYYSMPQYKE